MNSVVKQEKSVVKDLVPFFICWFLYCILPVETPSLWIVITKCSPIIALMHFVFYNGFQKRYKYSCRILIGLMFCAIGDAFLVSEDYFVHGLLSFTAGHLSYILAFGFKPIKLILYPVIGSMATMIGSTLVRKLTGVLRLVVPLYIFIISIMIWRAGARIQNAVWSWLQFLTLIGSILFAISDTILGINQFICAIPESQVIIMTFYYIAQLFITLSVLEDEVKKPHLKNDTIKEKKDEKKGESNTQESEYIRLKSEYEKLEKESEYEKQDSEYEKQESEYEKLESEYEKLESEYEKKGTKNKRHDSEKEREHESEKKRENEKEKGKERTEKKQREKGKERRRK